MMHVADRLPTFKNESKTVVGEHNTSDIINEVCKSHYL